MHTDILGSQIWDILTNSSDGQQKLAASSEGYIQNRLRETSVLDRAIPPQTITEAEFDLDIKNDHPKKIVFHEPDSKAMSLGFKAVGEAKWWNSNKFEVYMSKFETIHYIKTRQEMAMVRIPIYEILQRNFVLDIQEQLDTQFRRRLDAAATAAGNIFTVSGYLPEAHLKPIIQEGQRSIIHNNKIPTTLIMTEGRWTDVAQLKLEHWGNNVADITTQGNRNVKSFMGLKVITSINGRDSIGDGASSDTIELDKVGRALKQDAADYIADAPLTDQRQYQSVWPENSIYIITDPNFLGVNFKWGTLRNTVDIKGDRLEWFASQDQGFEIGNIYSVARIDIA